MAKKNDIVTPETAVRGEPAVRSEPGEITIEELKQVVVVDPSGAKFRLDEVNRGLFILRPGGHDNPV